MVKKYYAGIARFLCQEPESSLVLSDPDWLFHSPNSCPAPFDHFNLNFKYILRSLQNQNQNPNLIVVLKPMRTQVIAEEIEQVTRTLIDNGHSEHDVDPFAFNRYFAKVCSELGIVLIDPTLAMRADDQTHELYQPNDSHLSARGIRVMAEMIRKGIQD